MKHTSILVNAHNHLIALLPAAFQDISQSVHFAFAGHAQDGAFGHQSEVHD